MKPRIILIVVVVVVIIAVAGIIIIKFIGGNGSSSLAPAGTAMPSVPAGSGNQTVPIQTIYPNAPTGSRFPIGTASGIVQVNNFYTFGAGVGEDGVIVIKSTSTYWFTYDPSAGSFWIAVSGAPFSAVRTVAESDFLATLGVDQADACKLDVSVGVPYSAGNPLNGQSFPLSFCSTARQ